jgi:transketolase
MIFIAQSGHPGGSLSLADIMAYLYFARLKVDPNMPDRHDRDRVILSKGHAAPILYATLAERGFFAIEELSHLRKIGHLLQGHPCVNIPGIDATTGSLGLGLSNAVGMAIASKLEKMESKIHCILGDGELGEGQVWEAVMLAPRYELDNLIAVIDRNHYQNDGKTEEILPLEPLADKWRSFRWNVIEIDGHVFTQIDKAFAKADITDGTPTLIIANTIKGKGISYLLDQPNLHYAPPTKEQFERAMLELRD